jgi:hypothetical protein
MILVLAERGDLNPGFADAPFYEGKCGDVLCYSGIAILWHKVPQSSTKPLEAQKVAKNSSPQ